MKRPHRIYTLAFRNHEPRWQQRRVESQSRVLSIAADFKYSTSAIISSLFSSLFFIPHIFIPNIFIALLCISSLVFHPLVNLISSMYFHPLLLHHVFSSCFPFIQAFDFSSAKRRCQITSKLHCCCAC